MKFQEIINEGRSKGILYNGMVMSIIEGEDGFKLWAKTPKGEKLGFVEFSFGTEGTITAEELEVYEKHRGQGIAKAMYDFMKSQGYKIARSYQQTPDGRKFWDKNKGPDAKIWEHGREKGNLAEVDTRTLVNYVPKAGRSLSSLSPEKRQKRNNMMTKAYTKLIPRPDFSDEMKRYHSDKEKNKIASTKIGESWSKPKFNDKTLPYTGPKAKGIAMFSAGYHPDVGVAWIEAIKSEEPGAGKDMVKSFEDWAVQQGASVINAEALATSLEFWKKMGFTVRGKPNNKNRIPIQKNIKQDLKENYSSTTFNVDRRKLNVPALIQKGAIFVTYPHGEQGWETDNKEDWAFSLLSLYNVLQGGWSSEAKKYLKPASYKKAEQQINSSAPNLGSDKLVYDGKYNQILWSIKKLGIPDNVAFLDKGQQDVSEDTVDEMALKTYQPMGDFDKPGPFRGPDKKLVTHPVNQLKTQQFFERTPYDFRLFFSNIPGTGRYSEYGPMSPDNIKTIFKDQADQIIADSEDAITVVFVGNKGDSKVPITPWIMAHRFGHAIQAGIRGKQGWSAWSEAERHFFSTVNATLAQYYGKVDRGSGSSYMGRPKSEQMIFALTPEYNALFNAIGTQRSSRKGEIRRPYEFLYEIFAQYLGTGKVTFNPLPTNLGYGRKVFGNPTKYLNIKPEFRDEGERKEIADRLAYDMELLFNDVLSSSVGQIYIM